MSTQGERYMRHSHYNVLYNRWTSMRYRCSNPNYPQYAYYGGRGISVCKEWSEFDTFARWALSNGFNPELTLDRINTNENYGPDNCRWVDIRTQNRNKRTNIYICKDVLFADVYRIAYHPSVKECAFRNRIKKGMCLCEALYSKDSSHNYDNMTSLRAFHRHAFKPYIGYETFLKRVHNGVPFCMALWTKEI